MQECLTVVQPVKGKHCLALVLPDIQKILARYILKRHDYICNEELCSMFSIFLCTVCAFVGGEKYKFCSLSNSGLGSFAYRQETVDLLRDYIQQDFFLRLPIFVYLSIKRLDISIATFLAYPTFSHYYHMCIMGLSFFVNFGENCISLGEIGENRILRPVYNKNIFSIVCSKGCEFCSKVSTKY